MVIWKLVTKRNSTSRVNNHTTKIGAMSDPLWMLVFFFIGTDEDNFVDVVNRYHESFSPDIINSVEDDNDSEEE